MQWNITGTIITKKNTVKYYWHNYNKKQYSEMPVAQQQYKNTGKYYWHNYNKNTVKYYWHNYNKKKYSEILLAQL